METKSTREQTPRILPAARPVVHRPGTGGNAGWTARELAKMFRRRKWLIILCLLLITAAACAGTLAWQRFAPVYTVEAFIQVAPPNPSVLAALPPTTSAEILERYKRSHASMIKAPSILIKALDTDGVKRTQWFGTWGGNDPNLAAARRKLTAEIRVTPMPETDLIRVSMSQAARDEVSRQELPTLVNAVCEQFHDDANELVLGQLSRTIDQLNDRRERLAGDLANVQRNIQTAVRDSPVPAMRDRINVLTMEAQVLTAELVKLDGQMSQWISARRSFEEQRSQGRLTENSNVQQRLEFDQVLRTLRMNDVQLTAELKIAEDRFGPRHRTVQRIQTQLESIRNEIGTRSSQVVNDEIAAMAMSIESQFAAVTEQLLNVRERLDAVRAQARDLDTKLLEIENLNAREQEIKTSISAIDVKLLDMNLMRQDPRSRPATLRQRATVPLERTWPKWNVMVPAGVLLGLLAGFGLALLLETMDTSIKTPTDIARRVDMPLLAMIPHGDDLVENIEDFRRALLAAPQSLVGEAYRDLRTNLLFSGPDNQRRSLLVTSPSPADGRTSVAVSLAVAVAHSGRRVLLIDANFRRSSLRNLFPEAGEAGLSDALSAQKPWRECVHQTAVPNLSVMSTGKMPPNPNELLGSDLARNLLGEMVDEYDQVIFDGPPLLLISDASVLATLVDGVVLVVRAGVNTYGIVQRCRDSLARIGAHSIGVVLNGVRTSAGGYLRKNYESFYQYQGVES